MTCGVWIGAVPVHLNSFPQLDPQIEEQVSEMLQEAGIIVSRMETSESTLCSLLQRLKQRLSALEKDVLRDELKKEISEALEAGGIPLKLRDKMVIVFVSLLMEGIVLVHAEPGSSIILYLKCESFETLWSLKEMILSGLLLQLLSEVIKVFIESRPHIELIVREDDYNLTLACLLSVAGKFRRLLLLHLNHYKYVKKL